MLKIIKQNLKSNFFRLIGLKMKINMNKNYYLLKLIKNWS